VSVGNWLIVPGRRSGFRLALGLLSLRVSG